MPRQVVISNAFEGTTSTLQYIGEPLDVVYLSACYVLDTQQQVGDTTLGLFKGFAIDMVKDLTLASLIDRVPVNTPRSYNADRSGIFNVILRSETLPEGARIEVVASALGITG
jgi:hypothetical protein